MKIFHINCNYIMSSLHKELINHLDHIGIDSRVVVPTYTSNASCVQDDERVDIIKCFNKIDRYVFYYKQKKIVKSIKDNYSISDYNCIYAHTLFTDGNAAMELSRLYNVPYTVTIRNTDVNLFFRKVKYLRKRGIEILNHSSAVFFLSPAYQRTVLDNYVPVDIRSDIEKKCYIIPNGIDDYWLDNKNNNKEYFSEGKNHLKIIYAGGIDSNKNIMLSIQAAQLLIDSGWDVTLTVVGKIVDEKEYHAIENFPFVIYEKAKPKEELISFFRSSDIFVMPSHTETFGLVYAEAMSQGLPVIYTKEQGFDGQFPEGSVGYAVSDTDPKELAEKILLCVQNYKELSQNAMEKVDKFRWDSICASYKQIYQKITMDNPIG